MKFRVIHLVKHCVQAGDGGVILLGGRIGVNSLEFQFRDPCKYPGYIIINMSRQIVRVYNIPHVTSNTQGI